MPFIPDVKTNTGAFIPTTYNWDVSYINEIEVNSAEFKELFVRLYQNVNNIALVTNLKDTAYYLNEEFNTGQLFFNPASTNPLDLRPAFRKVINIGALGPGLTTIPHGLPITDTWKFTKIQGAASNAVAGALRYYPLPFAGAAGNNIEVRLDGTNVIINNASGVTFTDAYIIVEYLKF